MRMIKTLELTSEHRLVYKALSSDIASFEVELGTVKVVILPGSPYFNGLSKQFKKDMIRRYSHILN